VEGRRRRRIRERRASRSRTAAAVQEWDRRRGKVYTRACVRVCAAYAEIRVAGEWILSNGFACELNVCFYQYLLWLINGLVC
jgi:hypothetical protein